MRSSDWSSDVCSSDLEPAADDFAAALENNRLVWKADAAVVDRIRLPAYARLDYLTLVSRSLRPEELPASAYDDLWPEVTAHLRTELGRASCRERASRYVYISVVAGSLQKQHSN